MKKFYQEAVRLLSAGESIVLATIVHSSGSSPRSAGAKMIVRFDGSIIGTVGGGRLEAETIRLAKEVYATRLPVIQPFDLTGNDSAGLGMICGGAGKMIIDYVSAEGGVNQQVYEALLSTLEHAQKAWLITELTQDAERVRRRQQCLVLKDGTIIGDFQCEQKFLKRLSAAPASIAIHTDARDGRLYIMEPIRPAGTVYLFGAGHVSQQVARLTSMVGFQTVVLDDRADFANQERFPEAEVRLIEEFEELPELGIGSDSYLVIVTRGHLHDGSVLEQALGTKAAYIGMIGSKKKRSALYGALEKKGFSAEQLNRVYSPIGIDIYAETPEEIAVSIVAELIKARAERERCVAAKK
ncbi:XdhC family aldehyde oxidoreductase maturation factor [Azotosporobacter soli]|uniref:XdhC family aldehyde oxidoreductase maturation factor n=1 Tax=Azotosporobacter soli TaxID=3055040 RepID=UPI0031FF44F2